VNFTGLHRSLRWRRLDDTGVMQAVFPPSAVQKAKRQKKPLVMASVAELNVILSRLSQIYPLCSGSRT
jgi:hypothetical protein